MTPEVAVHGLLPDSKPGLPRIWPEQPPGGGEDGGGDEGGGLVTPQVGSPDWAGTLTAS